MSHEHTPIPRPASPAEGFSLSPDAVDEMFATVAAETVDAPPGLLARLRALPTRQRVLMVVMCQVLLATVAIQVRGVRVDIAGVVWPIAAVFLLAIAGIVVALRPASRANGTVARTWPWLVVVPAVISLPAVWPGVFMGFWQAMPMHVGCLWRGALVAVVATIPFLIVERHGLMRRWSLLSAAGSAGAVAFVVQVATCPLATLEHRVLAHGTAGMLIAAILVSAVWMQSRIRG